MKIKSVDFIFMLLMFVSSFVSIGGIIAKDGVSQQPFLLLCPASIATFFYLAFRVELGNKLK